MTIAMLVLGQDDALHARLKDDLRGTGRDIVAARSVAQAQARLADHRIGLVLIDGCPQDLARSALPQLRATVQGADLPIVVLAEDVGQGAADWARQAGATAAILRDAAAGDLRDLLRRLIG